MELPGSPSFASNLFALVPPDIITLIVEYLDPKSLAKLGGANKFFREKYSTDHRRWRAWTLSLQPSWSHLHSSKSTDHEFWLLEYLKLYEAVYMKKKLLRARKEQFASGTHSWGIKKTTGGSDNNDDGPSFFTSLLSKVGFLTFSSVSQLKVLLIGLDAAGKTTIAYKLKDGEVLTTIPTIGFNVEQTRVQKNFSFVIWDVGGPDKIRPLWRHYYEGKFALLFVVDGADRDRISEASGELQKLFFEPDFPSPIILIWLNKTDLPNCMSPEEFLSRTRLKENLPDEVVWKLVPCCAITGDGLMEGLDWLREQANAFNK